MHLVEILLPVRDNHGQPFSHEKFHTVGDKLIARLGGLTAFTRAPAEGFWRGGDNQRRLREDVIVLEIMVDHLDPEWWKVFRTEMETAFAQDEVVIRAQVIERL